MLSVVRGEVSASCGVTWEVVGCGTTGGGASVRPWGETGRGTEDGCLIKTALSSGEEMPDFGVTGGTSVSSLVNSEWTVSGTSCSAVCMADVSSPCSL